MGLGRCMCGGLFTVSRRKTFMVDDDTTLDFCRAFKTVTAIWRSHVSSSSSGVDHVKG